MTIQELRNKTGLSQSQFAERLEIPLGTIRNWEQGRRVPPNYVLRLIEKELNSDIKGNKKRK